MKNSCPFYIVFQVLKVRLIKNLKIEPPDFLFLLIVFISCYISRYHFSQIFLEFHSILSVKKIFVTNYNPPPPIPPATTPALTTKMLIVTKVFCLMLPESFPESSFWSFIVSCCSLILSLLNIVPWEGLFRYGTSISRCLAS